MMHATTVIDQKAEKMKATPAWPTDTKAFQRTKVIIQEIGPRSTNTTAQKTAAGCDLMDRNLVVLAVMRIADASENWPPPAPSVKSIMKNLQMTNSLCRQNSVPATADMQPRMMQTFATASDESFPAAKRMQETMSGSKARQHAQPYSMPVVENSRVSS